MNEERISKSKKAIESSSTDGLSDKGKKITRGLDLQVTDIVKSTVLESISQPDQDLYTQRWEELEEMLGRDGFNDLFTYIRMIFAKEKAQKSLLEEFTSIVLTKNPDSKKLIDDILVPYGDMLSIIKRIHYAATKNAQEINSYLRWLSRIDNSDWIPPSMMFLKQNAGDADYVLHFFKRMERLAAYMHICGKNVNDRIDCYSRIMDEIECRHPGGKHPHNLTNPLCSIELAKEEKEEFLECLAEPIYTLPPRRRNYLILRLDEFMACAGASYDLRILTIEHVLPQKVTPGSQWDKDWPNVQDRDFWIHRLANLVPLNRRRNSAAQNYDFDLKKQKYFTGNSNVSSYVLTTQVINAPLWTPSVVAQRQIALIDVIKREWELA